MSSGYSAAMIPLHLGKEEHPQNEFPVLLPFLAVLKVMEVPHLGQIISFFEDAVSLFANLAKKSAA